MANSIAGWRVATLVAEHNEVCQERDALLRAKFSLVCEGWSLKIHEIMGYVTTLPFLQRLRCFWFAF